MNRTQRILHLAAQNEKNVDTDQGQEQISPEISDHNNLILSENVEILFGDGLLLGNGDFIPNADNSMGPNLPSESSEILEIFADVINDSGTQDEILDHPNRELSPDENDRDYVNFNSNGSEHNEDNEHSEDYTPTVANNMDSKDSCEVISENSSEAVEVGSSRKRPRSTDKNDPDFIVNDEENGNSDSSNEEHENSDSVNEEGAEMNISVEKQTMAENKKKRKRQSRLNVDRSSWKRNDNKSKRMKGEVYLGFTRNKKKEWANNKARPSRIMGGRCNGKHCNKTKNVFQCSKITDHKRQELFARFWKDLSWDQKKIFVVNHVQKQEVKRRRSLPESRKNTSFLYNLPIGENRFRVCKKMFLGTLSIGEWSVRSWCEQSVSGTIPAAQNISKDRATLRESRGVISKDKKRRQILDNWFDKLPTLPSHYARHDTKKRYIEDNLITNKSQLYKRYLADEEIKKLGGKPLSFCTFSEMFDLKNLGIFKPRKDQCDTCVSYKVGNLEAVSEEEYMQHIISKDRARLEKEQDKESCLQGNCHVLTMDMQAVQLCPRMYASALYYRTKLRVHNFTVYNLATHQSTNFWWHEGEGKVDASNFTSCIIDYLDVQFKNSDKPIIIYSDSCGYQNKNSVLANALLNYAVKEKKTISQKYLTKGHTQMECDSVHSLIERSLDRREIYLPNEFISVTQRARDKPFPLEAKYLRSDFFLDYADPNFQWFKSIRPGDKCYQVSDVRALRYTPDGNIAYKCDFDSEFKNLGRSSKKPGGDFTYKKLYFTKPKISLEKYEHLSQITSVMDAEYINFYRNLPHEVLKKKKK